MDTKKMFSNRLREAMELRGMSITELAELSGLSKASVSEYLAGKYEAKQRSIYVMAKALRVDPAGLLGIGDLEVDKETNSIPVVSTIDSEYPLIKKEYLERYELLEDTDTSFAVKVNDNTMINAKITEGDYVYVSETAAVKNGDIILVKIRADKRILIRRYHRYGGQVVLRQEDITPTEETYAPKEVKILGKIVKRVTYFE